MRNRIWIGLLAAALVLSACSPADTAEDTTTTAAEATTSAAAETTTTTAPTTTTTPPEADNAELEVLMASLSQSEITSGRMEGSIEMTGLDATEAGVSEIVILFSTAFDNETGNSSFLMDMSSMADAIDIDETDPFAGMAAGFLGEMEFRQIGDRVFMKFPLFTAMFGAETEWVSMPAEESEDFTTGFESVPSDPNEVLDAYREADATVEDLGTETVNGVQATHYKITFDLEEMELTPQERAELEASGIFAEGVVPMDLWISEQGYMVRMRLEIDGTGLDVAPEEAFEKMIMTYDMVDINQPVTIEEPPASEVTDIEDLEGLGFGLVPDDNS